MPKATVGNLVFDFEHLRKSYGPVEALQDGSLKAKPGHCHAIVGDNGAGKSTFLKLLSGAEVADGGTIRDSDGQVVTIMSPGGRFAAEVSRRRALSRDQPVTPTTWPRIRPLSFFEALTYTLAYLVVTSARDIIDNPFLMPDNAHRYAGIPT